jgi:hypothetical protein
MEQLDAFTNQLRLDSVDSVDRIDFIGGIVSDGEEAKWFEDRAKSWLDYDYTPLQKTDEGYLIGRAVATTTGVFPYLQADGSIRMEARFPEHVFHPDSLKSLVMMPMTNDHPPGVAVVAENRDQYSVGNLGENVDSDELHGFVSVPLTIQQKDAVNDVEGGKRGLSCGYKTDIIIESGVFGGVKYDAIQTNIRYNHLAIVDEGRAGDDAILKMDGAMVIGHHINDTTQTINKGDGMDEEIKLDGITFKVNTRVKEHLKAANDRADTAETATQKADDSLVLAKKDNSELQAKFDASEKTNKEIQAKLDESIPKADIADHVASVKKMDAAIEKSGAKVNADDSDLDKKKAVIMAHDSEVVLDGKDDSYVNVYFDIACAKLDKLSEADVKNALLLKEDKKVVVDKKEVKADEITPEQKLKNDMSDKWKRGDK